MAKDNGNRSSTTARDRAELDAALGFALAGNSGAIGELLERVSTPAAIAGYRDGLELLIGALEAELLRRLEELAQLSRGGK